MYFSSAFVAIAEKEGKSVEVIPTKRCKQAVFLSGTVIIDLASWSKSHSAIYSYSMSSIRENNNILFIVSDGCQAKIVDLIYTGHLKIVRNISISDLRKFLRGSEDILCKNDMCKLTYREREIFMMKISGMSVNIIAKKLNVNIKTVYAHLYSILVKSGCRSLSSFYGKSLPFIGNMQSGVLLFKGLR